MSLLENSFLTPLFAQGPSLPSSSLPTEEKDFAYLSNDMALMVGLGIVLLLVLAFFARQSFGPGTRRRKRVSESRSVPDASMLPRIPSPKETKDRKRRRRKRSHRPVNPTLAETGGLPPQRENSETHGVENA